MKCHKCGKAIEETWPITVNGSIVDGCEACWEEECDQAWWKMFTKGVTA